MDNLTIRCGLFASLVAFTCSVAAEKLNDIEQKSFARQCFLAVTEKMSCYQARLDFAKKYNEKHYNVPNLDFEKNDTYHYGTVDIKSIGLNGANIASKVFIDYKCTYNPKHGWSKPETLEYKLSAECIFTDVVKNTYPKPTFFLTQDYTNNQILNSKIYIYEPFDKDVDYLLAHSSSSDWIDKEKVEGTILLTRTYEDRLKKYFEKYLTDWD